MAATLRSAPDQRRPRGVQAVRSGRRSRAMGLSRRVATPPAAAWPRRLLQTCGARLHDHGSDLRILVEPSGLSCGDLVFAGESAGFDECENELHDWAAKLYAEVRRELGLRHPEDVYKEPPGGFGIPDWVGEFPSTGEEETASRHVAVHTGTCNKGGRSPPAWKIGVVISLASSEHPAWRISKRSDCC